MSNYERLLGVNIDHVATVRNARGGTVPDPLRAALVAQAAGADGMIVEIHPEPDRALSDGAQSLTFEQFDDLFAAVKRLAESLDREIA